MVCANRLRIESAKIGTRPVRECALKWFTVSISDQMEAVAGIKLEKSSGNPLIDIRREHAIQLLILIESSLPAPPPEFRGRPIQFFAQFIYPPNP